jgi:phosphatidylserine/phosphatidylglycerophosphate/cardiolipin synthase-like enzyme
MRRHVALRCKLLPLVLLLLLLLLLALLPLLRVRIAPRTAVARPSVGLGLAPFAVYLPWLGKAPPPVLIAAAYIDSARKGEPDEAILLWNIGPDPISLGGWQLQSGAAALPLSGQAPLAALALPDSNQAPLAALTIPDSNQAPLAVLTIPPHARLWLAAEAFAFRQSFGEPPAAEWRADSDPLVPNLGGTLTLPNAGGALTLLDDHGTVVDVLLYGDETTPAPGWRGEPAALYTHGVVAAAGQVWQRKRDPLTNLPLDTDCAGDWAGDRADATWGRQVRWPGWHGWDPADWSIPPAFVADGVTTLAVGPEGLYTPVAAALGAARAGIDLSIYTLEHPQLAEILAAAARRGVQVRILLDGAPPGGITDLQKWCVARIVAAGGDVRYLAVPPDAPSGLKRRYRYLHAKYGIVDAPPAAGGAAALPPAALPTDALLAAVLPTDALPTDALPTDALPTDALPTDALPTDALPTDALPTDTLPAATLPAGTLPEVLPVAAFPAVPAAALPTALVLTENFSEDSLPLPAAAPVGGRRGFAILTTAPPVVAALRDLFAADWAPARFLDLRPYDPADPTYGAPPAGYTPPAPPQYDVPDAPFAAPLTVSGPAAFTVITAPENAFRPDQGLLALIAAAGPGDELSLMQLYEHRHWGPASSSPLADPNPRLAAFIAAARRGATVRILLDAFFDDPSAARSNAVTVAYVQAVAAAEGLDLQARLANPTGGGIHAKLLLARIGGRTFSAVGSLNGGEVSFKLNRELVLLCDIPAFYTGLYTVFRHDWSR